MDRQPEINMMFSGTRKKRAMHLPVLILMLPVLAFLPFVRGDDGIAEPDQETNKGLKYSTTWYGASWPGGPKWVQSHVSYLSALPDGRLVTACPWDEAHREQSLYSADGDLLGGYNDNKSRAIGGDSRYVYTAYGDKSEIGIERYPVANFRKQSREHGGIRYNELWARPAGFDGGRGKHNNRLPLAERTDRVRHRKDDGWRPPQQIRGIAGNGRIMAVTEDLTHHVHVIDAQTMKITRSIPFKYPGPVALDNNGTIWVIRRPERSGGRDENAQELGSYRIVQFGADGRPTGKRITDVVIPTDLAIGGPQNRLYVADIGPKRINVQIFDISGEQPRRTGELGEPGGVYAGPIPGRMGSHRFDFLSGVGVDDQGHIAISTRSRAGSIIRRFSPDGSKMLWQRYTSQFMNPSAFDPAYDGTVVFGGHGGYNRFVLDYNRRDRLDDWVAVTSDPRRFPGDYRWHRFHVRRLSNGKLYLVGDVKRDGTLILRREKDSEIFMPSLFLSTMGKGYPPHRPMDPKRPKHPNSRRVMWRDLNGDGRFDADEYVVVEHQQNQSRWQMDSAGSLWEHGGDYKGQRPGDPPGFLRYPLQGFDQHGNPIYEFPIRNAELYPQPDPFQGKRQKLVDKVTVQRFYYDADHDRMFISGYAHDYEGPAGGAGANFARYDHFTDPARCEQVGRIDFPTRADRKQKWYHIQSWAVAGDLVFAGLGRQISQEEFVFVYNTRTGEELGSMHVGDTLWGESSWLDITHALSALVRENGEIILTVENNWKNLQIVFRIPPGQKILEGMELPAGGLEQKKPAPFDAVDPTLRGR